MSHHRTIGCTANCRPNFTIADPASALLPSTPSISCSITHRKDKFSPLLFPPPSPLQEEKTVLDSPPSSPDDRPSTSSPNAPVLEASNELTYTSYASAPATAARGGSSTDALTAARSSALMIACPMSLCRSQPLFMYFANRTGTKPTPKPPANRGRYR